MVPSFEQGREKIGGPCNKFFSGGYILEKSNEITGGVSMKKVSRKLISVLTILAFILQIFAPTWTYAQDAQNQKAQIEKSVAEYQKTYDPIMAIEPLELGGMANFTINAIDTVKSWGSNVAGFFKGESKEEREKRQKEEEYNKYKAQIDRANEDIKKLKSDAEATMKLLKSGSLQAAAKTDPTKVYNSLDQNASAMGIYQKALREAGESLVSVADKIGAAGTAIGAFKLSDFRKLRRR